MDVNYMLRYRTFESLLADVQQDLRSISTLGIIEPNQLIKIAIKCNYDLGLRIHQTKGKVLEISYGKTKLPNDFYKLNYAFLCGSKTVTYHEVGGTNIEEVDVVQYQDWPEDQKFACDISPGATTNIIKCGKEFALVQHCKTHTSTYDYIYKIRFIPSKHVDCDCPNLNMMCDDEAYIQDGYIYTNVDSGNLYINYEGNLEDEDGNLLVPDHPFLNEYYEYALKQRILENLIMDGNENVKLQFELITGQLRAARNNALSIVRTPNFSEMHMVWQANRKAMYSRYYDMFKSHNIPATFKRDNT